MWRRAAWAALCFDVVSWGGIGLKPAAAVSLYVAHYNLCRVHEALRTTPAVALGVAERVWTIGDLIDAVLPLEPNRPVRVKRNFRVIEGGKA